MDKLRYILDGQILKDSPDGWSESTLNRNRDNEYFNVTEKYTTQLSFVFKGAEILKKKFYNKGFEGFCNFELQQLNERYNTYETIFTGITDGSTFSDEGEIVKIIINESNVWATIQSKINTEYEIKIDGFTPITIDADFPYLTQTIEFAVNQTGPTGVGYQINPIMEISNDTIDGSSTWVIPSPNYIGGSASPLPPNNQFLALSSIINSNLGDLSFDLTLNGEVSDLGLGVSVYFNVSDINGFGGANAVNLWQYTWGAGLPSHTFSFAVTNIPFPVGMNSGNLIFWFSTSELSTGVNSLDGILKVHYKKAPPSTKIKCLPLEEVIIQLLAKFDDTNPIYLASSKFITDTLIDNGTTQIRDVLTCGDAIRGLDGAIIKISLKKLFSSLNSIFCLGLDLDVDHKVKIEYREEFFNNVCIGDFGEVSKHRLFLLNDWIYNSFQIGTKEQTYDNINGKYEYNLQQNRTLPITKISKSQDLTTDVRNDIMGVLFTALNLGGKITTDASSDNDTWILNTSTLISSGVTTFNRQHTTGTALGFPDIDKMFNLKYTPKRNLLRGSKFFNSFLDKIANGSIKFASNVKSQSNLIVDNNDGLGIINENAYIDITTLTDKLFLPYIHEFTAVSTSKMSSNIFNYNKNGYYKFKVNSIQYKGYIYLETKNPYKDIAPTIKLISHKDNDLTQLI